MKKDTQKAHEGRQKREGP